MAVGFYPIPLVDSGVLQIVDSSGATVSLADYMATTTFANLNTNGTVAAANITTTANVTATGNISGVNVGGTLSTASQPNITAVGTLTSMSTSGDVTATGNVSGTNISGTGTVSMTGLPTSDPLVAGEIWNNAGVATVSAG